MNKTCPLCGFANAGNALRCESCQSLLRAAPRRIEQPAVSAKFASAGSRLVVTLLIVFVFAAFAIYKMFDNSSVAKSDGKTPVSDTSNSSLGNLARTEAEIEKEKADRLQRIQANNYRVKRERREKAKETPTDIFGNPQERGCQVSYNERGEKIERGDCHMVQ